MVNIDDFVKRLEIILDYYSLNASSFADKIGVQRSSMSHLLSGRNKPSLDFVLKILEVFPDVDLYWILNGKGTFPKSPEEIYNPKNNLPTEIENIISPTLPIDNTEPIDLFSSINVSEEKSVASKNSEMKNSNLNSDDEQIEKIVFFYKNGTFKAYNP